MDWKPDRNQTSGSICNYTAYAFDAMDWYLAWMDIGSLKTNLTIRTRKPGDRFCPMGMHGHHIKLSEFMINSKIPARLRDAWPIVCSGDDIIWVPGFRLGHHFQITPNTTEAVYMQLKRS